MVLKGISSGGKLLALHKKSEIPPTAVGGLVQILSTDSPQNSTCNPTHGSGWILQVASLKAFEQSTNFRWWD